jgi:hypothetical protein
MQVTQLTALLWLVWMVAGVDPAGVAVPPPPSDDRLVAVSTGKVVLQRADGTTLTENDFWAWLERAGGGRDEVARANLSIDERTRLTCEFADAVDWIDQARTRPDADDARRETLWRTTLRRAAYRQLVDGAAEGGDTPEAKQARLESVWDRDADMAVFDERLLRRAIDAGLDRDPTVQEAYRASVAHDMGARARREAEVALASGLRSTPDAPMADATPVGARPECLGGPPLPSLNQAEAAELQALFLARAASMRLRARSTLRIVSLPDFNP